jgi:hypothetical protein
MLAFDKASSAPDTVIPTDPKARGTGPTPGMVQSWTQRQVSAILDRKALYRDGIIRYGEINGQDNRLALLR